MADLHPEVQQEIDRLGKWYADHHKIGLSVRDDMRHVAALAVEREREECAKVCDEAAEYHRRFADRVAQRLCANNAAAIRRRGKP